MYRACGTFNECWLPVLIDGLDSETRECNSCSERMLQAIVGVKGSRVNTIDMLTPGTLSLSSYLTCIFLIVTCTLLIILAVKEAQRPWD